MGLLSVLGLALPGVKQKLRGAIVLTVACIILYSCSKQNDYQFSNTLEKTYIRIAQVDKDGSKSYSKVVLVNQ
ncbi:hypothetical protein [Niabella hibiscisoli]|uniref:hypothetical protein n=1 Tax=Niabella hibiscisoli TaxID=1825928 RepID=UPI001F0FAC07|nr:hypothetical protein [Niabella hibiscisoli]MCH5720139.1 hypothetical protein [Niabella hibiscisoli]